MVNPISSDSLRVVRVFRGPLRLLSPRPLSPARYEATCQEYLGHLTGRTEAVRDCNPEEARAITGAALPAVVLKFPVLPAKLQALHDSLTEKASVKTAGTAQPLRKMNRAGVNVGRRSATGGAAEEADKYDRYLVGVFVRAA